jgi:hypothetical protein
MSEILVYEKNIDDFFDDAEAVKYFRFQPF